MGNAILRVIAILSQKIRAFLKVICYVSKSVSERYSQTENEVTALVFACERFYQYLYRMPRITNRLNICSRRNPNLAPVSKKVFFICSRILIKWNIADPLVKALHRGKECGTIDYVYWIAKESVPKTKSISETMQLW